MTVNRTTWTAQIRAAGFKSGSAVPERCTQDEIRCLVGMDLLKQAWSRSFSCVDRFIIAPQSLLRFVDARKGPQLRDCQDLSAGSTGGANYMLCYSNLIEY
jgi:hypothetical protein